MHADTERPLYLYMLGTKSNFILMAMLLVQFHTKVIVFELSGNSWRFGREYFLPLKLKHDPTSHVYIYKRSMFITVFFFPYIYVYGSQYVEGTHL
jgi:hypothetical protein